MYLGDKSREEIDKSLEYAYHKCREVDIAVDTFAKDVVLGEQNKNKLPSAATLLSNIDWNRAARCIFLILI